MPTNPAPAPYKTCTYCQHPYTREEWDVLPSIGEMVDDVARVTLKNCAHCPGHPTTLGVEELLHPFAREAA